MAVNLKKSTAMELMSMTPLIDCVFLLLIFFLVAARFEQEERQLNVKLPAASEAKPLTARPKEVFINIDSQGQYLIQGKIVVSDRLAEILAAASRNNPTQSVVIRADKNVAWNYVAGAMNACNKAGITDYRVATAEGG
jgi:biopolymer transport protein ExbD